MGVSLGVTFPAGEPAWAVVAAELTAAAGPFAVRMIDGLPAFPDEQPEDGWAELRLGFAAGMVTIRRTPAAWTLTVWGTSDAALLRAQSLSTWAAASAGNGLVQTPAGPQTADQFRAHLA